MNSVIHYRIQNKRGKYLNYKRKWSKSEKHVLLFDTLKEAKDVLKTLRIGFILVESIHYSFKKVNGTNIVSSEVKLEKLNNEEKTI